MKKILALGFVALAATVSAQTNVFTEDFESYLDTTAVEAVWTASQAGVVVHTTDAGNAAEGGDKYMASPATAATLSITMPGVVTVTDADPLVLTYYVRAADYTGTRISVSVRDAGFLTNLYFSMGTSNLTASDVYTLRQFGWTITQTGLGSGYFALTNSGARTTAVWNKVRIIGGETFIRSEINDVNTPADDLTATAKPAVDAATVRIGYGVSSNLAYDVDNITVDAGLAAADVSDWDLYN